MMNTLMYDDLARAHLEARLDEAQQLRPGRRQVVARRWGRKAERAAQEAGLALSRAS